MITNAISNSLSYHKTQFVRRFEINTKLDICFGSGGHALIENVYFSFKFEHNLAFNVITVPQIRQLIRLMKIFKIQYLRSYTLSKNFPQRMLPNLES